MNHKRRRPKQGRAGCMLCKPHKHTGNVGADRRRERRRARTVEERAHSDG